MGTGFTHDADLQPAPHDGYADGHADGYADGHADDGRTHDGCSHRHLLRAHACAHDDDGPDAYELRPGPGTRRALHWRADHRAHRHFVCCGVRFHARRPPRPCYGAAYPCRYAPGIHGVRRAHDADDVHADGHADGIPFGVSFLQFLPGGHGIVRSLHVDMPARLRWKLLLRCSESGFRSGLLLGCSFDALKAVSVADFCWEP